MSTTVQSLPMVLEIWPVIVWMIIENREKYLPIIP